MLGEKGKRTHAKATQCFSFLFYSVNRLIICLSHKMAFKNGTMLQITYIFRWIIFFYYLY